MSRMHGIGHVFCQGIYICIGKWIVRILREKKVRGQKKYT